MSIAEQGFNIIVDSFIASKQEFDRYRQELEKYQIKFIYLYASEEIITHREEIRGDRLNGSALHWLKNFECQNECNLKIDTGNNTIEDICDRIIESCILGKS